MTLRPGRIFKITVGALAIGLFGLWLAGLIPTPSFDRAQIQLWIEAAGIWGPVVIVALMTELLQPQPGDVILEVGTGSGYQAAVLAELVKHVYSIEIIEELATSAAQTLQRLNYDNVTVRAGDGYAGWPEHAPFDGIIVTAAAEHLPLPLLQQLKPGGKLVIPVGEHDGYQELMLVEVDENGDVSRESVLPVRFVPLTGDR